MGQSVGTLNEKPLHAALKHWMAEPGDAVEAPVDGFIVDLLRGDRIIEIQTGHFSGIRRKLSELTRRHRVHLVHPIASERWIRKIGPGAGRGPARRKSPKRGAVVDIFVPLVSLPELVAHRNFSLEVVLTHEEEIRQRAPRRRRRQGWSTLERRLLRVVGSHSLRSVRDLARLLPDELPETFSTADLGAAMSRPRWFGQKAAYCLSRAGAIQEVGREGNARLFARNPRYCTPKGARKRAGSGTQTRSSSRGSNLVSPPA